MTNAVNLANAAPGLNGSGTNVTVAGDLTVSGGMVPSSSFLRNRIQNGDMRIDQRNAGASITPVNLQYSVDRFGCELSQASKYSVQQNAGAVTPPAGFTNYLGATSLSAYSSLSTDSFTLFQRIEGYNVSDLAWGTADAQTVTLSFWVRSSLTGTFGGSLRNSAANRSYVFSYAISAANTWERKSVTVTGDTTGTWLTTNDTGVNVFFDIGSGSNLKTTAGAWSAGNFKGVTGGVSVVGTNGATFYLTGVQLEVGSVATPFERRQFGQELALCQRYYENCGITVIPSSRGLYENTSWFKVEKRVVPSLTLAAGTLQGATVQGMNSLAFGGTPIGVSGFRQNTPTSGGDADAVIAVSAEL